MLPILWFGPLQNNTVLQCHHFWDTWPGRVPFSFLRCCWCHGWCFTKRAAVGSVIENRCRNLGSLFKKVLLDPYDPPWTRAAYSGLMRAGAFGWKIVVEKNQNDNSRYLRLPVVGFIFLQNSVEVFEILKLAVCPEYRHRGLARKLLTQTQNFAVTRQLPLTLEVSEHNVPARSLYSKSGFQEIARRPNYYASAVAACILKWP